MGAKIGAWVGITISGVVFLGGIVGAYAIQESGMYDTSEREFRKDAFESVASHYAIRALDNMDNPTENKWANTYFRYGIIKADNIDDVDLNDEDSYVERNFTEEITAEDLYIQSYEIGEDTQLSYTNNIFGGYSVTESYEAHIDSEAIDKIVYNTEDGIFYYETVDKFYPVRTVELGRMVDGGLMVYTFSYDFDKKLYRNEGAVVLGAAEEMQEAPKSASASESAGVDKNDDTTYILDADSASEVLRQQYLSLSMLDDTEYPYDQWSYLLLDGEKHYSNGEDVCWATYYYMSGKEIAAEQDYELTGDVLQFVYTDAADTAETYWVVTLLPEFVKFGWGEDLFVQANALVTLGYSLRYSIYLILAISLALGIFFFVFLIAAAGHRRETNAIVAGWIDKIPFELYLCLAGILEGFFTGVLIESSYYKDTVPGVVMLIFSILCMCWVALFSVLTFAVRVKLGKWWRNTIIWRVLHGISGVFRTIIAHLPLLWKVIGALVVIGIVDFILTVMIANYSNGAAVLWLVLRVVLALLVLFGFIQMNRLKEGGERIAAGDLHYQVDTEKMFWEFKAHGENLNSISTGMSRAVDEQMKSERFKTELITNVSHDIKTPLTSIINYVDLLEKEDLHNETAEEYLKVLERQSGRLKKLIEDLMEASKASTGNLAVNLEKLEAGVSMVQTVGEFEEKTKASGLELLITKPEKPVYIMADSRHFWRVIDNLMNNICKYAQPQTRVYINLEEKDGRVLMIFRNTSRYPLNISSEELMERFVRGDSSRNTEGSGLGISIAKSLMELMGGTFELYVDGDLFKVVLGFALMN